MHSHAQQGPIGVDLASHIAIAHTSSDTSWMVLTQPYPICDGACHETHPELAQCCSI